MRRVARGLRDRAGRAGPAAGRRARAPAPDGRTVDARRPAPEGRGGPRTGADQQRLLMVLWMEDLSLEVTVRS